MRPRSDTLLVWTGASCGYGCAACPIDPGLAPSGVQASDLQHRLVQTPHEGRLVVLVGGEPFLRPDFLRLVAAIRAAGCVPGLITTGRPLVYAQLRDKLRRAGLEYLRVQLFGVGEAHDRAAAVPGAFEQALAGLRAWTAEAEGSCDVDVALTVRGRPVDAVVAEIEPLVRALHGVDAQLVVALDEAARGALSQSEPLARRMSAFGVWNEDEGHPLLAWEGLPAGTVPGLLAATPLPATFVAAVPRASCLGPMLDPDTAATASSEDTRANSFNFIRAATSVPWTASADACTAHEAASGGDPARRVWLIEDDRLELYETDTGDFAPAEVARVKDELSHLFVDRSKPGVLDDFVEGMRRVLPDPTCTSCSHRATCSHRFRIVDGAPFAREEAWIAAHVAALRGRVLDVGCGEQLYRDELAPLVGSGIVQYTGLDPDELSLTSLRAVLPRGRFYLGSIEDFRGARASYDHILCLRSLNHVFDLDEAIGRMADFLRPGGSLLIVETTPFAMLRRREQVAAADRAPRAGHQHFRNVASEDVLPFARRHSLRVLHHHPASAQATNEWILLLERARAAPG